MAKQLSTATTPLCFGLFRCRVVVDFHVVQSALQNSIVYVAKSPFLLSPCESQDVCTVKAWLRGSVVTQVGDAILNMHKLKFILVRQFRVSRANILNRPWLFKR